MASAQAPAVVLLPIHPRFAAAILNRDKTVEFRKTKFNAEVKYVVMYCTAPVKRLVGHFEVQMVREGSPSQLWRRFGKLGCIGYGDYCEYFNGAPRGYAIAIGRVFRYAKPQPLARICRTKAPPQGFRYLPDAALARLTRSDTV